MDDSFNFFCRLELYPDGQGLLAKTFRELEPKLYSVSKWSLNETNLLVELSPIDRDAEAIKIHGTASDFALNLEMGGATNGWRTHLVLLKESIVNSRNSQAKSRLDLYGNQKAFSSTNKVVLTNAPTNPPK